MAGSEIPDRHADTNPQLGNGSVHGQIRNRSWEILPAERNFKEPLWFTHFCLTRASLCPHVTETKTMFSNGRNTQALRLQQFTRSISKFRNRAMAIRCQPSTKFAEVVWTKYKVRRNGLNPTNAVSRPNIAISGVFLDPVYQRMQNSTDHAIQNHMCWQSGILSSGAIQSLSSLTGQQMKKRVQAASAPLGCQICQIPIFWQPIEEKSCRISGNPWCQRFEWKMWKMKNTTTLFF